MIGFDISLTAILNFDLCTSYETGPSCICRSNQSVHTRLDMELTSVYHNSGQLFELSDVVHVASVQPHGAHCFIAGADKKINITIERRTKIES